MKETDSEGRMSRDEMASLQSQRLAHMVKYVYERVPHYRQALDEHGVHPADVHSIQDISLLPLTMKAEISAHYPHGLLAVPLAETVRVHASSGTTGKPINVFYTKKDLENWIHCVARGLRTAGVEPSDLCQIAFRYSLFTGAFGHHRGAEAIGATVIPTSSGQTERQIMVMQDLRTTVLHCTPSYAVVIAEKMEEMGVEKGTLSLRLGIHGAEPMSDELRDEIQERLGIRVARDYGLTEVGGPGVSVECEAQSGYHINEDFFYPEVIDPATGTALPEGEIGELVFTTLAKEASPLLRYRTRDISSLTWQPCACGRNLVRHGPILGRTDDMLIVGGVNFFPSQVEGILLKFGELTSHYVIRLTQEERRDRVTVDVELEPTSWSERTPQRMEETKRKVESKLKDLVGFGMEIRLLEPLALPRSEGKSKRVLDER